MPEQKKVVKITVLLRIYFVVAETQVERERKKKERDPNCLFPKCCSKFKEIGIVAPNLKRLFAPYF